MIFFFPKLQVLEVMEKGEMDQERWSMPEEEEEQEEFWGFEDLEYECNSSLSISPRDSISTGSFLESRGLDS